MNTIVLALTLVLGLPLHAFAAPADDKLRDRQERLNQRGLGRGVVREIVVVASDGGALDIVGTCAKLRINWGDGSPVLDFTNFDLTAHRSAVHSYSGWRGMKTVTAEGLDGCIGKIKKTFTFSPTLYKLAYAASQTKMCQPIPNRPDLPNNSRVSVAVDGSPDISFCPFNSCKYGGSGKPGSSAGSNFPFSGMREFSLVFRVGSQTFQGGSGPMSFIVPQGGPLEVCVNDGNLSDNGGGWMIDLVVDMLGVP